MRVNWVEGLLFNNMLWTTFQKRQIVSLWRDLVDLKPGFTALEVGCGRGVGSVLFYEEFKPRRIDAVDNDQDMVDKAQKHVRADYDGRINVAVGDVTRLQAADGSYDVVFDFFTMHYVEDWIRGIEEVSRVLKPGGYFAFGEIYENAARSPFVKHVLKHDFEGMFDRQSWVKALAGNRLRLMERKNNLWNYGMAGVARKSI